MDFDAVACCVAPVLQKMVLVGACTSSVCCRMEPRNQTCCNHDQGSYKTYCPPEDGATLKDLTRESAITIKPGRHLHRMRLLICKHIIAGTSFPEGYFI